MKFSIIVPSYNQGAFIERTLNSILSQRGDFETEIKVVDGGSIDNTVNILHSFEERIDANTLPGIHSRVTFSWQSEKDRGQSHAINKGIEKSAGDIVAYINSDDIYHPGAFASVANFFERNPDRKWCYGQCTIINDSDKTIRNFVGVYKKFIGGTYRYSKLLIANFIPQPATFLRRDVLQEFGTFKEDEHYVMDYEYWCRIGQIHVAGVLRQELASCRIHTNTKSSLAMSQMFREGYDVACRYTVSPVIRGLHRVHDWCIMTVYRVMDAISRVG